MLLYWSLQGVPHRKRGYSIHVRVLVCQWLLVAVHSKIIHKKHTRTHTDTMAGNQQDGQHQRHAQPQERQLKAEGGVLEDLQRSVGGKARPYLGSPRVANIVSRDTSGCATQNRGYNIHARLRVCQWLLGGVANTATQSGCI